MNSSLPFNLALGTQLVLLTYHFTTTVFDFFPFNGARFMTAKEKLLEVSTNDVLMALSPVGFICHLHGLMIFGVVYYGVLFFGEIATWGLPYAFGAKPRWRDYHARVYAQTITILPQIGDHPTPNLEHMIINFLTLITAVATGYSWKIGF